MYLRALTEVDVWQMVMQSLASWQSGVGGTCAPEHHKPVGVVCTPSSHSA